MTSTLFNQVQVVESHTGCPNLEFGGMSVLVLEWESGRRGGGGVGGVGSGGGASFLLNPRATGLTPC